jgi:hypothetical protein
LVQKNHEIFIKQSALKSTHSRHQECNNLAAWPTTSSQAHVLREGHKMKLYGQGNCGLAICCGYKFSVYAQHLNCFDCMFRLCRGGTVVQTFHCILSNFIFNCTAFPKHANGITRFLDFFYRLIFYKIRKT